VVGQAKRFAKEIVDGTKRARGRLRQTVLEGLRNQLETMLLRVRQVMRQTRTRIFRGETRIEGKLLSLFEPSTEIIRKGKAGKPNEFGKIVKLQEAENQILIDYEVYDQRPSDSKLLIPAIETHETMLRRTPRLVAADAGFYSAKNETAARPRRRVSNGYAFPIAPPRAPRAGPSRRSAGSAMARNGAPDARAASA
jgi:IS5 family transposase